jgi:hypothetical protein
LQLAKSLLELCVIFVNAVFFRVGYFQHNYSFALSLEGGSFVGHYRYGNIFAIDVAGKLLHFLADEVDVFLGELLSSFVLLQEKIALLLKPP